MKIKALSVIVLAAVVTDCSSLKPRGFATKLARTILGGAKMVLETSQHPGALKDQVTSPGGTTIEGLHALEKGRLRATVMSAVRAATEESKKLGQS